MGLRSRLHKVVFSSGNNPMSTIEFVENRGVDLFEDFSDERKNFNPRIIPEAVHTDNKYTVEGLPNFNNFIWSDNVDINLPVFVGGKNGSGKTSFLLGIKIICDLLNRTNISEAESKKAWSEINSMNISYINCIFSATIDELSSRDEFSFVDSITSVVMDSNDKNKMLNWCDGVQIRNINFNISEREFYRSYGVFKSIKKNKKLPEHKTTIGGLRIEKFLHRLQKETEGVSKSGPDYGPSLLNKEVGKILDRFKNNPHKPYEIDFQQAVMLDINRKEVEKELQWMKKLVPKITNLYEKFTTDSKFLEKELEKVSIEEWFSVIYGPAKNVLELKENGKWDMKMWAPKIIEDLQHPYSSFDVTPYWFRNSGDWKEKKDAMRFVTNGALLDIVSWITGQPQLEKSFYESKKGLIWSKKDEQRFDFFEGQIEYEKGKGVREIPSLSDALRNPVLAKLVGMNQDEESTSRIDILLRMNFFTPIEEFTSDYLTSGQRQILALIIAVRNSPKGSLILIDEPELSLHVDWQSSLVEQLHLPLTESQLVIATHSPDITMNHLHLCNILLTNSRGGYND
tara:strand:+ start:488 stop:2194 length:1707 start_codon:yes stop_codon:yes gene_type:complete